MNILSSLPAIRALTLSGLEPKAQPQRADLERILLNVAFNAAEAMPLGNRC